MNASVPALATPLGEEKSALLQRLLEGLDGSSLTWLSGYFAGLAARQLPGTLPAAPPAAAVQAAPQGTLTLVYGTQTGNSRLLAERLKQRAEAAGLAVRSFRASEYPVRELKNERLLYVVISTQGDGDPPDDARGFFEFVRSKRAPALNQLRFAVLGLGDSSYPKFCEIGRVLDERFAELGATRLFARAECDVDFEPVAGPWLGQALEHAKKELAPAPSLATITPLRSVQVPPTFSRENPYPSQVLSNQRITGRGALKDVRHLELSLEGSGLTYEPGDALGVVPRNPPELVAAVLSELRLDGDTDVSREGRTLPLKRWLTEELEITRLSRPFLASHAARSSSNTELQRLLTPEGGEALRALLASHQVIDLLRQHPGTWSAEALVGALRRLTPRLYSIASSQKRVGEEVHLTLGVVDYEAFGSRHVGAASNYLSTREAGQDTVDVFIEANERFRLPKDPSRDIIMIGPGTGVAPFRAFVQERAETGASGRNWLFFGEQHFRTQFLYQVEWQEAVKQGSLHRIDLAFSRDQGQKVYVQNRLREKGSEVYAWLEGGAFLYVCGDAKRMAPDVDDALIDIIATHGGKSREDAKAHLESLREQQRYLRDVY
ncbi:assimilatory sulfite reductase (NADPH) flavoprotein subunit [Archangium lansingense]|uniref:Assimilatory sulfite reductase (NADPH) flavoprotein subunit n=1 Tax=Archangium lansingense TaxID=2995310 RepID=A0ABT4A6J3_9BACT|nr:assimilatory sulfite reductase (NADPH) flavoprotein subunit [Archangium lansinium]MCY1077267.1 assimilatory sulfite reductase (NADPH) flavoprotein subunit [Archangium lansinium]